MLVAAIPLVALATAAVCGLAYLLGQRSERVFTALALSGIGLALVGAAVVFGRALMGAPLGGLVLPYLSFGSHTLSLSIHADSLSALMLVVVALVSFLVQLYSTQYMKGDAAFGRYFSFINLFSFAMLSLVVVDDLFSVYMCWELVGLGSYLLIGHWYAKPSAAQAAKKAFVITRIGDFGFLLGILLLFKLFGTLDLHALSLAAQHLDAAKPVLGMAPPTVLMVAMVLLFWGPIGKSAQFPLHVWLPDAMEGPTPVSALIHAATMVAAGVYLTARTMFLFAAAPHPALVFVGWIGGITALLAASLALVQWDIKRILAYSTVSQLGYMMLALGFGPIGLAAAIFHLFNHAFFKALLFLGSGSVIHSTDTQDIREMGGLRKFMPWTFWPFTLATLSISGFPLLSGFWSKDAILGLAWQHDRALWAIGTLVAGMTAFYMFRLWFHTFTGEHRGKPAHAEGNGSHGGHASHPHESPWQMTLPLVVLAIPSVLSGYWGTPWHDGFASYLWGGLAHSQALRPVPEIATNAVLGLARGEWFAMAVSTIFALGGIALAWTFYGRRAAGALSEPLERLGVVWTFLERKAMFDDVYAWIRDRVYLGACAVCSGFDRYVVDGVVNLVGLANLGAGESLRQTQSGKAQTYLWWAVAGTTFMAIVLVIFGGSLRAWAAGALAAVLLAGFTLYDRLARA